MSLPNTESPTAESVIDQPRAPVSINKRFLGWCLYLVILCGAFALPLSAFVTYARHSDVHSYVLLIPFVTAYLIYIRWKQLSRELTSAWGYALLLAAIGTGAPWSKRMRISRRRCCQAASGEIKNRFHLVPR